MRRKDQKRVDNQIDNSPSTCAMILNFHQSAKADQCSFDIYFGKVRNSAS